MNLLLEKIVKLIFCHLVGDYVLQLDVIAHTKGNNWYHLFVHCALYCLPFYIAFGWKWQLGVLFVTHLIIDSLKARYNKISYATDQVAHYMILMLYLIN